MKGGNTRRFARIRLVSQSPRLVGDPVGLDGVRHAPPPDSLDFGALAQPQASDRRLGTRESLGAW